MALGFLLPLLQTSPHVLFSFFSLKELVFLVVKVPSSYIDPNAP